MIQNNIKTIKDFIFNDEIIDILLCNILNDELKLFYIYIIEYFCKRKNLTLQINIEKEFVDDLFTKNIQLFETTSEKKF